MCHHCVSSRLVPGLSRRHFLLASTGTATLGGFLLKSAASASLGASPAAETSDQWPEVRVAFLRPREDYWLGWPGTFWDVKGFIAKSTRLIEQYGQEQKVRTVFTPEPLYDDAAVDQFIAQAKIDPIKGVLVIPLHMDRWGMVDRVARSGVPTLVFAPLGTGFTGHFHDISYLQGVYLASSADFELKPVRFGLKMIRTGHDIRRTRVAVIAGDSTEEQVLEPFGLTIRRIPRRRFPEVLAQVSEDDEVKAVVDEYRIHARRIVEPSQDDLVNAARNYVAARRILETEHCQGITMDCLGLVSSREIPCPPCLAWSKFLDVGVPAICEADINAVMSHTLCCKLLDKPGFMQDPVPETVNNTFIGAHCVCPTRLSGYDQPAEPFVLRSHSESDLGVSVQVLWPEGREVTVMQFNGPGCIWLGRGKVLRNHETPPAGGCRTSVELALDAPADTRETKGFHQLFILGDHLREFAAYAQFHGITTEHI